MEILIRIGHACLAITLFYFMTEMRKNSKEGSVFKRKWIQAIFAINVATASLLAIFPLSKVLILMSTLSVTTLFLIAIFIKMRITFIDKDIYSFYTKGNTNEKVSKAHHHVGGRPNDRG